jgi:heparosan-N-sulfate-glucuronate 5-epimerase
MLSRRPQLIGAFEAGDPQSGYYNDLTDKALEQGTPQQATATLDSMTKERRLSNAVSIAQLGLGAWQLSSEEPEWLPVVERASNWIVSQLDEEGRLAYLFAMPHTYDLDPPWYSAMAQGEAVSLLVRAAAALERPELLESAAKAARSLIDESSGLVARTPEGPVLQEYPTTPPAHALNGWIFALWGLYDVGLALATDPDGANRSAAAQAASGFAEGVDALTARLTLYDAGCNWSRYDLFPRRMPHAASPFYHRLHIEQLRATARLRPEHSELTEVADRWDLGARSVVGRGYGLSLKIAFRIVRPRKSPGA